MNFNKISDHQHQFCFMNPHRNALGSFSESDISSGLPIKNSEEPNISRKERRNEKMSSVVGGLAGPCGGGCG
jgi:hypothetical protein